MEGRDITWMIMMAYIYMMGKKVNVWSDNWSPSNKDGKPHPICTTNSYALLNVSSLIDPAPRHGI